MPKKKITRVPRAQPRKTSGARRRSPVRRRIPTKRNAPKRSPLGMSPPSYVVFGPNSSASQLYRLLRP